MDGPDEPTAVIRMKRDFDEFLSGSRLGRSGLSLNLDQDITGEVSFGGSKSAVSMNTLLEKEKENMLKDAEIKRAQCEISKLKNDLMSEQTSRKRCRIEYEKDIDSFKGEQERNEEKLKDLKSKLSYLLNREKDLEEEVEEIRQEMNQKRKQYDEKMSVMQNDVFRLQEELQQEKQLSSEKCAELQNEIFRLQSEQRDTNIELDESRCQLQLQKTNNSEMQKTMADLTEFKLKFEEAEHRVKELEFKISQIEEDAIVNKAMRTTLSAVPTLEKEIQKLQEENAHLREIQENNILLKEQTENMKQKLERSEKRCEHLSSLEAENMELKEKLKTWESAETENKTLQTPSQLSQRVQYLQESQVVMLEKQGQLQSSLHSKEETLRKSQQQNENLIAQLTTEKTKGQQQTQFIKRLQRKLLLISKERDMYKNLIDSYQSEVTVNIENITSSRVHQLEEIVESYRKQVESMEAELSKNSQDMEEMTRSSQIVPVSGSSKSSENLDQNTILQLRERIAFLEKELEKSFEEKCTLEARIEQRHLQGDYDPSKMKVLHFSMNPATMAQKHRGEELQKLREENERLKTRLKIIEESGGQVQDVSFQVEQKMAEPSSSKELEEMKKLLENKELKNQRLLEAFKKTSQEFREVCYQLMGYKIDIPCANKYKITSMYAESPEDFFMFEQSPSGEVQFMASDFAESLQDHIDLYISKSNSIPAFLSAVTLDLFGRQTVNMG